MFTYLLFAHAYVAVKIIFLSTQLTTMSLDFSISYASCLADIIRIFLLVIIGFQYNRIVMN